jgi:hypothetical protein
VDLDNKELIRLREVVKELDEFFTHPESGMIPISSITFFHSKIKWLDDDHTSFEISASYLLRGVLSELRVIKENLIKIKSK